jgi:transcription antitermination protein NusB
MSESSRRYARRTAFILVYQWDVTGRALASLFEGDVDPYACELAEGVVESAEDLDRRITAASEGWPADRLGAVERSILRLAVFELDRGLPAPIAIDEAVRLAKRYATDEAAKLVNGVLGRIHREREVV